MGDDSSTLLARKIPPVYHYERFLHVSWSYLLSASNAIFPHIKMPQFTGCWGKKSDLECFSQALKHQCSLFRAFTRSLLSSEEEDATERGNAVNSYIHQYRLLFP